MKCRNISHLFPFLAVCLLAGLFTACSAIKRGKVIKKGVSQTGSKLNPGPIHWVDIRGENSKGKVVTARIQFFEMDWKAIKKNDWIEPASFGFPRFFERIHAYNEAQRAESGRFGASAKIAKKSKPKSKRRIAAKPTPTEAAAESTAAATPAPESTPAPQSAPTSNSEKPRAERLKEVREVAMEDPVVRELKAGIKNAKSEEEQQRAWKEYRSTLRDKMHAIDPTLGDLIDEAEGSSQAR